MNQHTFTSSNPEGSMTDVTKIRDGDISKVFISVETLPMLTFVPLHSAPPHRPISSDISSQSHASVHGNSASHLAINHNLSVKDVEKSMDCLLPHPPVDIIIEDCCDSDGRDVECNNNHDANWTHKISSTSLESSNRRDSMSSTALCPIDEELHLPHPLDEHLDTSDLTLLTQEQCDILSLNDLDKIKGITRRLNLQTRRGSYLTWRSKLSTTLGKEKHLDDQRNESDDDKICRISPEEAKSGLTQRMTDALTSIRAELMELRQQDESLARQFICIRNNIQKLKLEHTQQEYNDMVDDAQCTLAENVEYEKVCDEPRTLDKSPLITLGITKMNLTERRFSVF